jgi:hypothetical protein
LWLGSSPETSQTFELTLAIYDPQFNQVDLATSEITIRPINDYWSLWSTRTQNSGTSPVPTESGRTGNLQTYQPPKYVAPDSNVPPRGVFTTDNASPDAGRQVLVFVHGFNTSEADTVEEGNTLYQRLYWAGYRGDLVAFDWQGDDKGTNGGQANFVQYYNRNVRHAFETAPTFATWLKSDVDVWAGGASNVNILAHSLGNMVAWEALRETAATPNAPKIANNLLSVESAIPQEAFDPLGPVTYQYFGNNAPPAGTRYIANSDGSQFLSLDDRITYSVDDLEKMSWEGWFNNPGDEPTNALTGYAFNSYSPNDSVLDGIYLTSDKVTHGTIGPQPQAHYYRPENDGYRTFNESDDYASIWGKGELLTTRTLFYGQSDLTQAIGTVPNPLVDATNATNPLTDPYADVNATQLGWSPNQDPTKNGGDHSYLYDATTAATYDWYLGFIGDALGFHQGQVPQ